MASKPKRYLVLILITVCLEKKNRKDNVCGVCCHTNCVFRFCAPIIIIFLFDGCRKREATMKLKTSDMAEFHQR